MPLITRRSSTRALPRVSVGRCGLIFENCAFVSQNWSRLIYASFSEAVNHATTFVPTLLWVRTLAYAVATQGPEMHGPPMYFTPEWDKAGDSVRKLAALEPELVVTGVCTEN